MRDFEVVSGIAATTRRWPSTKLVKSASTRPYNSTSRTSPAAVLAAALAVTHVVQALSGAVCFVSLSGHRPVICLAEPTADGRGDNLGCCSTTHAGCPQEIEYQ